MLLELTCHRDTPCDAISAITVEVGRPRSTAVSLRYAVTGDMSRLVVPGARRPSEPFELWRTTCFEAFIRKSHSSGYYEFNLSPHGYWAAYEFSGYREGMTPHPGVETRGSGRRDDASRLERTIIFDLDRLDLAEREAWRMGLSTVIEEAGGRMSYWALAHAPGKPDFHHPDSFAFDLEPA